jgi:amino acid adenylation domain-containing protein
MSAQPLPFPPGPRSHGPRTGLCLHHLFEQQARQAPGAVAVVGGGQRLSYAELNRRADRLAGRLRRLGVGPGVLVGLCTERSPEAVVGILGTLKAGGAYVPLDPTYPKPYLAAMLEDSQVPVLVTQPDLEGHLPTHGASLVFPDGDGEGGEAPDLGPPEGGAGPDDLAYVLFTSGSTGRPKGVMVSHRNVVSLFQATQPFFRFGPQDVWSLFHSCAFDFSVWELWGALLHGGRLVVVPSEVGRSPREFLGLLRAEGVTVLSQTPSVFRQLIRAEELRLAGPPLALRWVVFGGEALNLEALRPWLDRHGDDRPQLVNMYGITETTVHVTLRPVRRADLDGAAGSVIGGPIPGWSVHLLDAQGRPVPDGEVGEIYVGGRGVARGYLNRPELDAERFLPDPFGPDAAARLYRSGDLARRRPDGDLVYVGRIDHQVKVRGNRIELPSVESVLTRHPAVREAAVVAEEGPDGAKRLVAYLATGDAPPPGVAALRGFLQDKLPDYMVPAVFVFLDRLPLTGNGKVDRDKLPRPCPDRPALAGEAVPAATDLQRRLQALWEDLLRVRPVGIRDNFFELGGDSLLAMRLSLAVGEALGKDLTPAALGAHPTVEQLADLLDGPGEVPARRPLVALQPRGDRPPLFLVHGLGGEVASLAPLAQLLGPGQPCYGLQDPSAYGPAAAPPRLEQLAARYAAEVRRAQPAGPYYLGGYSLGALIAQEMAQQLLHLGHRVALLAALDEGPASGRERLLSPPAALPRFLANLPRWLADELSRRAPAALGRDGLRKLRVWRRRLSRRARPPADLEEVVDASGSAPADRAAMAARYQAYRAYTPRPYPGRVTLFRARVQPLFGCHRPDLGWGEAARGGVEVHVVPGNHATMLREPGVRALAASLSAALGRAQAGQKGEPGAGPG